MSERARQFIPFAALRGYYDLISEQERVKEPKRILSDEESAVLSEKLKCIRKGGMLKVVYYNVDAYETMEGFVSTVDFTFRTLSIIKTKISFDDILDVSGPDIPED